MSKRARPNPEDEDEKSEYHFEKHYTKCEHTIHKFGNHGNNHHGNELYNHFEAGRTPRVTISGPCSDCKARQELEGFTLDKQTSILRGQVNSYVVKLDEYNRKIQGQAKLLDQHRRMHAKDAAEIEQSRIACATDDTNRNLRESEYKKYQAEKEAEILQLKAALDEKTVQVKQHQAYRDAINKEFAVLVQRYNYQGQIIGSLRRVVQEFQQFNGGNVVNGVLVPLPPQQTQQIQNVASQSGNMQDRSNPTASAVQNPLQPLGSPRKSIPPPQKIPQIQKSAMHAGTMAPRRNSSAPAVQSLNQHPLGSLANSLPPPQKEARIQNLATQAGSMQLISNSAAPAVQTPNLPPLGRPGNSFQPPQKQPRIQMFAKQTGTMQPPSKPAASVVQNPNLQPFGSPRNPFPPGQKGPWIQNFAKQMGTMQPQRKAPTAGVQSLDLHPLGSPGNSLLPLQKPPQTQNAASQSENILPRSTSTAPAVHSPNCHLFGSPGTSIPPPPAVQQDTLKEKKLKLIATIGYINPIISGFTSLKTELEEHKWESFLTSLFTELEQAVRWEEICTVRDRMRGSAEAFDKDLRERIEKAQGEIVGACEEGVGRLLAAVL